MIKKYILITLCAVIGLSVQAQLKVGSNSNIGIGTDPTSAEKLTISGNSYFNGNIGIGTSASTSTVKLTVSGTSYFTGNIGIGVAPTTGAFAPKLTVNGISFFKTSGSYGARISDTWYYTPPVNGVGYAYQLPVIYCDYPNYSGLLGTVSNPFYEIRGVNVYYTSLIQSSDMRLKKNIKKAPDSKDKLNKINIYQYDLNEKNFQYQDDTVKAISMAKYKNQTGVMAQELKEIFPELVAYDSINDVYGVNYVGLIPHLVQAVQDQNKAMEAQSKEIETQNKKLENQNREIATLKTELAYYQTNCCSNVKAPKKSATIDNGSTGQANLSDAIFAARLDQNTPNPFTQETRIGYFIPEQTQTASLFIYDLQGKQLKHIAIYTRGEGSISIQGREFKAGMYLYTLVIDNDQIDTKRMILTE